MSADPSCILEVIVAGSGLALDLGGNRGAMRGPLERPGWRYINLDIKRFGSSDPSVIGDARALPFQHASFDLAITKDALEDFVDAWLAVQDIYRILQPAGLFVVWVPFMHPFHGNDFARYTPVGLQRLLSGFEILRFDDPLWVFTVLGLVLRRVLKRAGLGVMEPAVRNLPCVLDRCFTTRQCRPQGFASAYRLVARKRCGDFGRTGASQPTGEPSWESSR